MEALDKLKKSLTIKKGLKMDKTRENNLTKNNPTQKNDKGALWINTIYKMRQKKTIKNISFKICKEYYINQKGAKNE